MSSRSMLIYVLLVFMVSVFFTCIGYVCFDVSAQELSMKQTDYISSWTYTLCSFKISSTPSGGCLYTSCLIGSFSVPSVCKYNISYSCSYNTSMISCFYNKDSSELSLTFPSLQNLPIFPNPKLIIVVILFILLGSFMTGCFGMMIGTTFKEDRIVVVPPFPIQIPTLHGNQGPV